MKPSLKVMQMLRLPVASGTSPATRSILWFKGQKRLYCTPSEVSRRRGADFGFARRHPRWTAAFASVSTHFPEQQELDVPHQNTTTNSSGPSPLTFQDAIGALQSYWASKGCIVWLPHNTEVGAGTMNPATFLRVQGPEPWNVCYCEPSIRPDDSRYGDNPNRIQRHTQFQVILKPEPGNAQVNIQDHPQVVVVALATVEFCLHIVDCWERHQYAILFQVFSIVLRIVLDFGCVSRFC